MSPFLMSCMEANKSNTDSANDTNSLTGEDVQFDILFLLDNSASMADENAAIVASINSFSEALGAGSHQIAITTASVDYTAGATGDIDPGETGLFAAPPTLITDSNVESIFDDAVAALGTTGSGNEEHLEGILLSLCRQSDAPPALCFESPSPITEDDIGSNDSFLRTGSTLAIVIITDEGDNSRRMQQGEEDASVYLDAYQEFGHSVIVSTIGPDYDASSSAFGCNSSGAQSFTVERFASLTNMSNGLYFPIEEDDGSGACVMTDLESHLQEIAAHILAN